MRSSVLLKNAGNLLPAAPGKKIYVEGISKEEAARFGTVVDDPKSADLVILRVASPATTYPYGGSFAMGMPRGGAAPAAPPPLATYGITLAYGNAANWTVLENIRKVAASGTPTVVIINLDKPAILTEFIDNVPGVFGAFGASDAVGQTAVRSAERHAVRDGSGGRRPVRHGRSLVQVRVWADIRQVANTVRA